MSPPRDNTAKNDVSVREEPGTRSWGGAQISLHRGIASTPLSQLRHKERPAWSHLIVVFVLAMTRTRSRAKAPAAKGGKGSKGKAEAAPALAAAKAKDTIDGDAALAAVKALEEADEKAKTTKIAERLARIFGGKKSATADEIMAALENCECGAALDKGGECTSKKCTEVGAGGKDTTGTGGKGKGNGGKRPIGDVSSNDNYNNDGNKKAKKKGKDSGGETTDDESEYYKGDGLMMAKLRAMRKLKYGKRAEMAAAAAPKMQTTTVKDLEIGSTSAAALALGGALARELRAQVPDWDLWEADGPLACVRRLHQEDPHAMAAAAGAWEDPRTTRWVAEHAAGADLIGGLDNSLLAAALLGPVTGLALLSGAGRPRAVAWRGAPLVSYVATQVATLVDEAVEEATRMAAVGSAAGRMVAAADDMAHADVWGALGQCAPGDLASLGTRFAWFAAQVAYESANPVAVGAVAQVLLHGMLLGMGLPLAARKGDGPAPGTYLDALTARATARDLRVAGVTPGDVDATLQALGWGSKRQGDGGGGNSNNNDGTARNNAKQRKGDKGGGGGAANSGGGSGGGGADSKKNKSVPPVPTKSPEDMGGSSEEEGAKPAAKKAAAKAGAPRGGSPAADSYYYLDPSELRDAAGKERCRFFAKDGSCSRSPCRFSHKPAAKSGPRK